MDHENPPSRIWQRLWFNLKKIKKYNRGLLYFGTSFIASVIILTAVIVRIVFYPPDSDMTRSDYCNLRSCKGETHTMCTFTPNETNDDNCGIGCRNIGLTPVEITNLLNYHNMLRGLVAEGKLSLQPPAIEKKIPPLVWHKQLAEIAQAWANQCVEGNDKCRNVFSMEVGQNSAHGFISNATHSRLYELVAKWAINAKHVDKNIVKRFKFTTNEISQYTQMVWARTKYVGCGYVECTKDFFKFKSYLVCNYGPAGNVVGEPVYKTN